MRILLTWLSSELVSRTSFGVLGAFRVERTQLQSRRGFWCLLPNEDAPLSAPEEPERLQGSRWSDRRATWSTQGSLRRRASFIDDSSAATTSARALIIDSSRGVALLRGNHDREVDMHISTGEEDAERRHEASLLCRERIWSQNDELRDDQMDNTQRARYEQRLADMILQAEEQRRENTLRYEEQRSLLRNEIQTWNRKKDQDKENAMRENRAKADRDVNELRESLREIAAALSEQQKIRENARANERSIRLDLETQLGKAQDSIATITHEREGMETGHAQLMALRRAARRNRLEFEEDDRRWMRETEERENSMLSCLHHLHLNPAQQELREKDHALRKQQQDNDTDTARARQRLAEVTDRLSRKRRELNEAREKRNQAQREKNEAEAALQEARNQKRERDRKRAEEEEKGRTQPRTSA
ncbi:unnamed protein product [Amoebophrya sp. A120]|nr:unnamed protein product [Amoebophrya sp. A120]|eukprot:GSA120T00012288001.1